MNTDPTPEPSTENAIRPARRAYLPNLFACVFGVVAVGVLAGLVLPLSNRVCVKGPQTRALAQAKQIGLALKLFAGDHDGNYPRMGIPALMSPTPADSNAAFACLFPDYVQAETIFGNPYSVYQTAPPDNVIDKPYTGTPKETLQPGENVYSYVMGLSDADSPATPLVVDGTDGTGHYTRDPHRRGGVWKGERAIVIYLDNHGALETLTGPDNARFVPASAPSVASRQPSPTNLLDFSGFGQRVRLLDPAVGPRRQ